MRAPETKLLSTGDRQLAEDGCHVNRVWVPRRRQLTHFVLDHERDSRSFGVSHTYPLSAILSLLWNALQGPLDMVQERSIHSIQKNSTQGA